MKWKVFSLFAILSMVALLFVGCDELFGDKDEEPAEVTPEQAKAELRAAYQQMNTSMEAMMNTETGLSLNYLYELMEGESFKSLYVDLFKNDNHVSITDLYDVARTQLNISETREDPELGFYEYNFLTDTIDLVKESSDTLQVKYPADAQAYMDQQLNAVMMVWGIELQEIEFSETYWDEDLQEWVTETHNEEIPVHAEIEFTIDDEVLMSGEYESTLNNEGRPTFVSVSMLIELYQFNMTFSGAGLTYTSTMSFKNNGVNMLSYDAGLIYTADMESVEKVTGDLKVYPISFDGYVNAFALQTSIENSQSNGDPFDYDYLNTQIDIEVGHTVLDAPLGILVIKEYTDPESGEKSPNIAIEYSDGSWEWLSDIAQPDK